MPNTTDHIITEQWAYNRAAYYFDTIKPLLSPVKDVPTITIPSLIGKIVAQHPNPDDAFRAFLDELRSHHKRDTKRGKWYRATLAGGPEQRAWAVIKQVFDFFMERRAYTPEQRNHFERMLGRIETARWNARTEQLERERAAERNGANAPTRTHKDLD